MKRHETTVQVYYFQGYSGPHPPLKQKKLCIKSRLRTDVTKACIKDTYLLIDLKNGLVSRQ